MDNKNCNYRVLVADDDQSVHEALEEAFADSCLHLLSAYDGAQAADMMKRTNPDILVTDIVMPKMDGLELLRKVREESDLPVIILSARSDEFDRLLGLQLGADDYITKPFSAKEVAMRINIILKRLTPSVPEEKQYVLTIGNLTINRKAYDVKLNGESIPFTAKEVEIIWTLAKNSGMVFTREHLVETVWGYDYRGDIRSVDSHIKRIRAKLSCKDNSWDIQTVWGVGYRFEIL